MEDHYSKYDLNAFLADPDFMAWVKYGEQHTRWEAFLRAHPCQRDTVEQATAIILAAASQPLHYPGEQDRLAMWANIKESTQEASAAALPAIKHTWSTAALPEAPAPTRTYGRIGWYGAAAAVLLGLIVVPLLWHASVKSDNYAMLLRRAGLQNSHRTEAVNDTHKPLWVPLPDGSNAVLSPGSRLSFADDFNHRNMREVYLSGAAFFEVNKRAVQPFIVYANTLAIKVLGTSFCVSAATDLPDVQVQVKSGKVLLFTHHTENGLVVNARQQAGLSKGQLYLASAHTDSLQSAPAAVDSSLMAAVQIPLTFEDAALPQVFDALEAAYGITIHYDKTKLSHCRLTAFLSDEPLPEKIRLICKAIQAPYEITGNEVKIQLKSCNK
ncbi:FecR family protein [Chitinophaga costaii]|uniref:FecR family protein n=1 Tax=Chitinophaga costaii TaxID=1335309 RepID=A0A1C4DTW1_9BACT|nr:FecR family protein [Chitinophaga costaii]PUZ27789.1 FecR family protein [Chitinophaga costaii]SCC34779.1 FecR family protein [Chitinophaga costaii]